MKKRSNRKFTYQGQAYDLPDYFDCHLEVYVIEPNLEKAGEYFLPTVRKDLSVWESWSGASKVKVLSEINWEIAKHSDAVKVIAENTRMGKYLGSYDVHDSTFATRFPVRIKAGACILKPFLYYFKGEDCRVNLIPFKNNDCAALYKMFLYPTGGDYWLDANFLSELCFKNIYADYFAKDTWLKPLRSDQNRTIAGIMIKRILQISSSPEEFFSTFDHSNFKKDGLREYNKLSPYWNFPTKKSFEAFETPPFCECDLGIVNYLDLWYQIKKQLFHIINEN